MLGLLSALTITLLFVASHATAAVHAKSRPHSAASSSKVRARKRAVATRSTSRHSNRPDVKKSSKKASAKKHSTSTSTTSTTTTTSSSTQTTQTTQSATSTTSTTAATTSLASATTTGASTTGSVLFNGSPITNWWLNQSATPTRVQLVPDPSGAADTVQQFTTYNTDVAPLTPTVNPRSQLVSPTSVLKPGNTYWESFEVYIPQSFQFLANGWVSLQTAVYGYPYAGTPPLSISLENGSFRFQRNAYGGYPWQIAWSTPVVKGQWYRFTWHFLFSSTGWAELYVNNVQQKLKVGASLVSRLPISLLDPTDYKGPWISDEQLYYQLGMFPSTTAYFKNYMVATTQTAAGTSLG